MYVYAVLFALVDLSYQYLPMVGMVVTISPSLSLYKMVVFPAASRPTIKCKRQSLISYTYWYNGTNSAQKRGRVFSSCTCTNNYTNVRHFQKH